MREFDFGEAVAQGTSATVPFSVPADLAYLEGHFPGAPIVPGVAQIVALAEARARVLWPDLGPSRGLRRVKFKKGLYPGDALEIRFEREPDRVSFRIHGRGDGGELYSQGAILFGA